MITTVGHDGQDGIARTTQPWQFGQKRTTMVTMIGHSKKGSQNGTTRSGKPELDSKNVAARRGQPKRDFQTRTGRPGEAKWDRLSWTGKSGQAEWDRQNSIGSKKQAEQTDRRGRQKMRGRAGLPEQVCQDKNADKGLP